MDPPVGDVGVCGFGPAGAQDEAGSSFPLMVEAAWGVERVAWEGVAPVGEHAAAPDSRQLFGIADGDEAPLAGLGEVNEAGEVGGRGHACLVEDHRRACRPRRRRVAMTREEPSERVGLTTSRRGEHISGFARRGEPDHLAPLGTESSDSARGRVRLAGPCWPDDEHEPVAPGDRPRRVELWIVRRLDRPRGAGRPCLERLLLGEQSGGGESPVGHRFADGPAVGSATDGRASFGSEWHTLLLGEGGEPVDLPDQLGRGRAAC